MNTLPYPLILKGYRNQIFILKDYRNLFLIVKINLTPSEIVRASEVQPRFIKISRKFLSIIFKLKNSFIDYAHFHSFVRNLKMLGAVLLDCMENHM